MAEASSDILSSESAASCNRRATKKNIEKQDWNVEAVVCGDGTVGNCGLQMKIGVIYATGTMTGGYENYHPINEGSFVFQGNGDRTADFATRPLTREEGRHPRSFVVPLIRRTRSIPTERSTAAHRTRALLAFLKANPGVAVVLGGPGERPKNIECEDYHIREAGDLMATSATLDCIPATVVNSLAALKGKEVAGKAVAIVKNCRTKFKKLGAVERLINSLGVKCCILKAKPEQKNIDWLSELESGVWLVRLLVLNAVNHCVVIDGTRKHILDSEEPFPMKLCKRALMLCGGGRTRKLIFAEVFELVRAARKAK